MASKNQDRAAREARERLKAYQARQTVHEHATKRRFRDNVVAIIGVLVIAALSTATMIFSIAPAVAPILGGWIVTLSDWRSIFLSLLAYSILLFIFCYRRLPETLAPEKRHPFNPRFLVRNYG